MSTEATAAILAGFRSGDAWRNLSWELAERFPNVPEAEREDRLQQAFVIALEKCRATERPGVYDFLRIAARRELLHHVNGKAHSTRHGAPDFDFDALASREPDPLDALLDAERVAAIAGCVDELSERRRAVLVRRLCNGESRADIAAALGASLKTVKTQLEHAARDFHRAVRKTAGSGCEQEWEERVAKLAFRAYEPDEEADVRAHLSECAECDAYHANLRWIASAAAAMLPLPAAGVGSAGPLAALHGLLRHPLRGARRLAGGAGHGGAAGSTGAVSFQPATALGTKALALAAGAALVAGGGYGIHAAAASKPAHHARHAPAPLRSHPATPEPAAAAKLPAAHKPTGRPHAKHRRRAVHRATSTTNSAPPATTPRSVTPSPTPALTPRLPTNPQRGGEFF